MSHDQCSLPFSSREKRVQFRTVHPGRSLLPGRTPRGQQPSEGVRGGPRARLRRPGHELTECPPPTLPTPLNVATASRLNRMHAPLQNSRFSIQRNSIPVPVMRTREADRHAACFVRCRRPERRHDLIEEIRTVTTPDRDSHSHNHRICTPRSSAESSHTMPKDSILLSIHRRVHMPKRIMHKTKRIRPVP